jgi:precorrin-6B methylase 2
VYSLSDYLWMVADERRAAAYANALRAAVRPGDRVLEVGTGIGFFAVVAARAGAGHVDAVDTNPVIHLAADVAALNGCQDRITFHHSAVADIVLPTPADVLLIDVRGPTPFGSRSLETLIDARDRLLRPGGRIIARADRVMVAPARAPETFRLEVMPSHMREGVRLDSVERIVFDTPMSCAMGPDDLVAVGQCWTVLDYETVKSTDAAGSAVWEFDRATSIDGLAVWFEADLGHGISFTSAPGGTVSTYRQLFIPFCRPIAVENGDEFRVDTSTRQVRENYVWAWRGWRRHSASTTEELVVDQNSLAEIVLHPGALPQTSEDVVPSLGPRGVALRALLSGLDGRHTIGALADRLFGDSPRLFRDRRAAQDFIAEWVGRLDDLERGGA